MSTTSSAVVSDLVLGSAAGLGATVAMEYPRSSLYEHAELAAALRKEEQLCEVMPTVAIAALTETCWRAVPGGRA